MKHNLVALRLVAASSFICFAFAPIFATPAAESQKVALFVTEWARSATGGGTQVPTSDAAVWTLLITVKNLTAHHLNNVQVQAAIYKRLPNGSIQEVNLGGHGGGAPQQMIHPAMIQHGRRMGQFNPAHLQGAQQGRFAETIHLRVGEMKQIKVEGTIGGAGASGGYRQQNFTGRGGIIGGNQPLQAAGSNQQGAEKYVGYSVVVYFNGEIIARADRNPERLPNFGIGGAAR